MIKTPESKVAQELEGLKNLRRKMSDFMSRTPSSTWDPRSHPGHKDQLPLILVFTARGSLHGMSDSFWTREGRAWRKNGGTPECLELI